MQQSKEKQLLQPGWHFASSRRNARAGLWLPPAVRREGPAWFLGLAFRAYRACTVQGQISEVYA